VNETTLKRYIQANIDRKLLDDAQSLKKRNYDNVEVYYFYADDVNGAEREGMKILKEKGQASKNKNGSSVDKIQEGIVYFISYLDVRNEEYKLHGNYETIHDDDYDDYYYDDDSDDDNSDKDLDGLNYQFRKMFNFESELKIHPTLILFILINTITNYILK
jgi:hypothetical protein